MTGLPLAPQTHLKRAFWLPSLPLHFPGPCILPLTFITSLCISLFFQLINLLAISMKNNDPKRISNCSLYRNIFQPFLDTNFCTLVPPSLCLQMNAPVGAKVESPIPALQPTPPLYLLFCTIDCTFPLQLNYCYQHTNWL